MKRSSRWNGIIWLGSLLLGAPALGQTYSDDAETSNAETSDQILNDVGRTAKTGEGEIGQRQERSKMAPNIDPLARINNRIENRIQNRLRNRIDRNYDATANATAPFERAEKETKKAESGPAPN